jgi:hypothetical protein
MVVLASTLPDGPWLAVPSSVSTVTAQVPPVPAP